MVRGGLFISEARAPVFVCLLLSAICLWPFLEVWTLVVGRELRSHFARFLAASLENAFSGTAKSTRVTCRVGE